MSRCAIHSYRLNLSGKLHVDHQRIANVELNTLFSH